MDNDELSEEDEDALWNESFRNTQAELQEMANRVVAAHKAGLTKPLDLDALCDVSDETNESTEKDK